MDIPSSKEKPMSRPVQFLNVVLLALATGASGGENQPPPDQAKVVRDRVKGAILHPSHSPGSWVWSRTIGKVTVIDSNSLEFADGTRVSLGLVAPEPGQMGRIDGKLYPCGKEAAEFLRRRIGDRPVTYFTTGEAATAYVGDESIAHLMIINGWALAVHSSQHAAEIIARENKRGMWRGEFVDPIKWREGERLPGEERTARP
jgi:endonuclease YncB( thermonuclease family)